MLNQININTKFTVSVMLMVTQKFVPNLDCHILLLKISLSAGLLELLPQHEVAARFCVWEKELTNHLPAC